MKERWIFSILFLQAAASFVAFLITKSSFYLFGVIITSLAILWSAIAVAINNGKGRVTPRTAVGLPDVRGLRLDRPPRVRPRTMPLATSRQPRR